MDEETIEERLDEEVVEEGVGKLTPLAKTMLRRMKRNRPYNSSDLAVLINKSMYHTSPCIREVKVQNLVLTSEKNGKYYITIKPEVKDYFYNRVQ